MADNRASRNRARIAFALALTSLATPACLPRGETPAGKQILANRDAHVLGLVPPNGDGMLRVLFFLPGKDADNFNLWVVAVDPSGVASPPLQLFTDIDSGFQLSYRPMVGSGSFGHDARGRLFLTKTLGVGPDATIELYRVDPVSGETVDLGPGDFSRASASGQRVVIDRYSATDTSYVLYEDDGTMTAIDGSSATFVGETLYYQNSAGDLMRFPAGGTAQAVASGVYQFTYVNDRTLLLVKAVGAVIPTPGDQFRMPTQVTASLFDTTTLEESRLPDGLLYQSSAQFSPDGRWLSVVMPGQDPTNVFNGTWVLIDTQTGTIEPLDPPFGFNGGWRPGHTEMWASPYDPSGSGSLSDSSLFIKRPGQPVTQLPGMQFETFNADGTYWFSRGASFKARESSELVGLADDPTGPRYPAVPDGSSMNFNMGAALSDGRILTTSTVGQPSFAPYFVQIVDPRTGSLWLLGQQGYVSAVGHTRVLGLYQVSYLQGDLTATDLAAGKSTVLAAEFAGSSVVEPQGDDPCPARGRVVYGFRSRFESPWDGLWLATMP